MFPNPRDVLHRTVFKIFSSHLPRILPTPFLTPRPLPFPENPAVLNELERSLALLAFESPETCPFNDLLHPCQRHKVASELNSAILAAENKDSVPKISNLLKLLLWAQNELDSKKVVYPKMVNLSTAELQMSNK